MNIRSRIAVAVLGAGMLAAPALMSAQNYGQGGYQGNGQGYQGGYQANGPGYQGNGNGQGSWDAPPREFTRDIQRQGFRDGMYGAQKDFENHRQPGVSNRDEFRNYRGPERRNYRNAFQRGYSAWWNHQGGARRRY